MRDVAKSCPDCGSETILVALDVVGHLRAVLPDRFMALEPVPCSLTCKACHRNWSGEIRGLEIESDKGRIHFDDIDFVS